MSNLQENQEFHINRTPTLPESHVCLRKLDDEDLENYDIDIDKVAEQLAKPSNESSINETRLSRPRRKAAPVGNCFREPSVKEKLRRKT